MADKVEVIVQQSLKPIKLIKWKVNEGNSISIGCVYLLYEVDDDDKHVVCKLKSTQAGTVYKLLAQEGDVVKPGARLLEIQACTHPTVMRDMCAECGADLRKDDVATEASIPMVHSVPELKVSLEQARKLGQADLDRLLKDRKLVLLVDLDQTLIHTTNDNIPANLKDVYHFQLNGAHSPWYHTRLRPGTHQFLLNMSPFFELHICTFGARNYAHMIAMFLDQDGKLFSQRILSRDECFNPTSKTANLTALFPCGDNMVCIIDDREDVWSYATNLIHVKPYHFFQHTGDINAPPGLDKHESDDKEGVDLTKVTNEKKQKVNGINEDKTDNLETLHNGSDKQDIVVDVDEEEEPKNITNGSLAIEDTEERNMLNTIPVRLSIEEDMPIFNEESQTECKNVEGSKTEEDETSDAKKVEIDQSKITLETEEMEVEKKEEKSIQTYDGNKINCTEENITNSNNINKVVEENEEITNKEECGDYKEINCKEDNKLVEKTIEESCSKAEIDPPINNLKTNTVIEKRLEKEESPTKINCKEIKHHEIETSDTNKIIVGTVKEIMVDRIQGEYANIENMEEKSCVSEEIQTDENCKEQIDERKIEENIDERILENDSNKENVKETCAKQETKDEIQECPKQENINKIENINDASCEKDDSTQKEDDNNEHEISTQKEDNNEHEIEKLCENKEEIKTPENQENDVIEENKASNNVEDNHKTYEVQNNFKVFSNNDKNNENKEYELIEIEDSDDYLLYLEDILKTIHKAFYDTYDKLEAGNVPDLKQVIPDVRRNVLQNTKLVFSGLVPTHIKLEQSRAYQVAKFLGATVTQDLQRDTTHLVAVRPGTAKVNVGRRKKNLKIVTPDWLWACAERWLKVEEKLYPLNNKGSKNRHPPPHCSSPEHAANFDGKDTRKRTPSGRFMDTINPLMSFSSADIADMDREVEDIFLESESDGESSKKPTEAELLESKLLTELKNSDEESSSSAESLTSDHPHGYKSGRKRLRDEQDVEDESTADEYPSTKFRRGEELSSDLDIGQESNSEGSVDAPDEIDDGDWNMMGAALEREFLANN